MSQQREPQVDPQALSALLDCAWVEARNRRASHQRPASSQQPTRAPRAYDHSADAHQLLQAGWSEQQIIDLSPSFIVIEGHPTTGQMTCTATNREASNRVDTAAHRTRERAQSDRDQAVLDAAAQAVLAPRQRLCTQRQIDYITLLQARSLRAGEESSITEASTLTTPGQVRAMTIEQTSHVIACLMGER